MSDNAFLQKAKKLLNSNINNRTISNEFRNLQKSLSVDQRKLLRTDRNIIRNLFDLDISPKLTTAADYYCWDNTTLSLWEFLSALIPTLDVDSIVQEIGCGPYATLSLALKKKFIHLNISASEIEKDRVSTAQLTAEYNQIHLSIIQSDLLASLDKKYDLIFMNPPYVPSGQQQDISGSQEENPSEWQSGHGGDDGTLVIRSLLSEAHPKLNKNGLIALGINNYFIEDHLLKTLFSEYNYTIEGLFKNQSACIPDGVFAQVYLLKRTKA
jgi:16S rRNA G1207 methylase RsmC